MNRSPLGISGLFAWEVFWIGKGCLPGSLDVNLVDYISPKGQKFLSLAIQNTA